MLYQTKFAGRELKIETNSFASQASGCALVSFGKTVVLGTATMGGKDIEADFLPLTVDYEERFYAAGRIIGSRYVRREGRPSEEAILLARMIDRTIRPYFPSNLRREVQVVLTVFAFDEENDPEFPSLIAASVALSISNIPWNGPVAGARVAYLTETKELVLNPTYEQRDKAKLDLFIAGIGDETDDVLFNMLDGQAKEALEEETLQAIQFSKDHLKNLFSFQKEIQNKEGKPKIIVPINDKKNLEDLSKKYYNKIKEILFSRKEDNKSKAAMIEEFKTETGIDSSTFEMLEEKIFHQVVLKEGIRPDGRGFDEIRKISCQAGIIPQTHGSGLFCRGLTHVLSIVTLGGPGEELLVEGMEIVGKKRFLHHYNFPPYSSGEVRRMSSPGRREIGHGALAEKALRPMVPDVEKFPYTIRIVSEVLSSNGSTSMASVCASSLALFDAGVPMKKAVAGISCGLIMDGEDETKLISQRDYKLLTDIQGPEDHFGDMDFKVAGTSDGITAIQLDIKVKGLTLEILKQGLEKAKEARNKILAKMNEAISLPREELSPLAPKILTIKIDPEKIGDVIGSGGKIINEIISETDTSIEIKEDGLVFVTAKDKEKAQKAIDRIYNITREIKVGEVFQGKVKKVMDFGIFIELLPKREGLLHISEISSFRRQTKKDLMQKFKVGDIVSVKVRNIDEGGKVSLVLFPKK
ncbi:MAG TPA: polyribonucleotide nucleotidyltransferase [Candidatus Pacearchaeota archaeon]|nr:polyribonucleotide nucleotidyltransferase [Candidatus Pacearchaeota archaeon]HPZ74264.1 polyribonucleotide nucleotidyltransferase [Candidatus Pacearchaeota archaeon]